MEGTIAEIKGASKCFHKSYHKFLNYRCPTAKFQERDELMRESWVKTMELRLVRAELDKCHKAEGVNHYENCRWLAEKYLGMMQTARVRCFYISPACVYYFWLTLMLL